MDYSYFYDFSERSTRIGEQLRKSYRELAQLYGCEFIDVNDYASADGNDGVHLSPDGHRIVGEKMAQLVKSIL